MFVIFEELTENQVEQLCGCVPIICTGNTAMVPSQCWFDHADLFDFAPVAELHSNFTVTYL